MEKHIENFTSWEASGDLQKGLEMIRKASVMNARGRPFAEAYSTVRQQVLDSGLKVLNEVTGGA
jgi:hypothetical protein